MSGDLRAWCPCRGPEGSHRRSGEPSRPSSTTLHPHLPGPAPHHPFYYHSEREALRLWKEGVGRRWDQTCPMRISAISLTGKLPAYSIRRDCSGLRFLSLFELGGDALERVSLLCRIAGSGSQRTASSCSAFDFAEA